MASKLNHPNVCTIYEVGEAEGQAFIAMELVEGEDLSQRIERGAVPVDEVVPIALQMAQALEAAHERGMRVVAGKTCMDRNAPEGLRDSRVPGLEQRLD